MNKVLMRYLGRDAFFYAADGGAGAGGEGDAGGGAGAGDKGGAGDAGADKGAGGGDAAKGGAEGAGDADKGGQEGGGDKGKPAAAGDILGVDPAAKKDGDGKKPDAENKTPPAGETAEQKIAREKSEAEAKEKADKEAADKKAAEKKAPKEGYTVDAKAAGLPEGFVVDEGVKKIFDPVAVELDLSPEQYNKMAGAYGKVKEAELIAFADTVKGWKETAAKDSEIGGDKWDQSVADSRMLLDEYGTPELRQHLFYSGQGNHPELIRFCAKLGAALRQGQGIIPAGKGGKAGSQADRLYGGGTA